MEQNQNPLQFDAENQQASPFEQGAANQNQQAAPFYQEYQQPTYTYTAAKKRINPAVIIVPVAILAVAAAVLLIVLLSGGGGYKGAEGKYISQLMGGLSSALSETEKVSTEPQSLTVSFEPSNSQITDYIGISNITLVTESAVKGEDVFAHMSVALGDSIYNGKFWVDSENGDILMVLPEISSVYLQASFAIDESVQEPMIDAEKALEAFGDVISQTLETYFEIVGDTKVEGGQTLVVNGEEYKADKTVIKLDKVQIAKVCKSFLENLVNNDDAMDILCTYYGGNKDEVIETLGIDDSIEEFEDIIEEGDGSAGSFEMTVWMQGGSIIGRDIAITSDSGTGNLSFYQIPVSGGSVTYVEVLPDNFRFYNEDNVNGELHSGTVTVSDSDNEVTVEYKDMAVTDSLFQGEAKIVITGSEAFEITAVLSSEGDTRTVLISVPNVCKVTVTAGPSQLSYEDRPQLSEGQVAVIDSSGDFYEDEAFNQFLNDILMFVLGSDLYL